jgi:hypothetical protein
MMQKFLILLPLLLAGCANPFVQFYQDRTGGHDLTKSPVVVLPTGEPKLYRGADKDADYQRMLENGYNLVGYSSFNGANVNFNDALTQAKSVHAEIVLVYSKHTETRSGVMPLTLPDIQTSTTTLSGSAFGSGGYGSFSGTANTTTYGTQTTYIPYSVDRHDVLASYWIKIKPPVFGVHTRELTPELRQRIGSNKGVHVFAVIRNSPAWKADVLKDDIITKISNTEILDRSSFRKVVGENHGKMVTVEILRNGRRITKEIIFDNPK